MRQNASRRGLFLFIVTISLTIVGAGIASALVIFLPRPLDDPTPQTFDAFGLAVAGSGDVNGDGVPDVLVSSLGNAGGHQFQGRVFLFSGADSSLLRTLDNPTPQAYAYFGWAVAEAGDVNGDGVSDQLVGARTQTVGANQYQGEAFVFSGADGSLLRTLDDPTPQAYANVGFAGAGVGDVNSDGVPDLLVGAPGQTVGANEYQGEAFLFSGADGSLLRTLDDPISQDHVRFGWAMSGVGDVNGDGVPDLLVSAPFQGNPAMLEQGQAFLFNGADGSLLGLLNNQTPQADAHFGSALAGIGDVNGDGVPDLLVGTPGQTVGANFRTGQALLFVSGPTIP